MHKKKRKKGGYSAIRELSNVLKTKIVPKKLYSQVSESIDENNQEKIGSISAKCDTKLLSLHTIPAYNAKKMKKGVILQFKSSQMC